MFKKVLNATVAILIAGSFLLSVSSCKKDKDSSSSTPKVTTPTYYFKYTNNGTTTTLTDATFTLSSGLYMLQAKDASKGISIIISMPESAFTKGAATYKINDYQNPDKIVTMGATILNSGGSPEPYAASSTDGGSIAVTEYKAGSNLKGTITANLESPLTQAKTSITGDFNAQVK